MIGTMQHRLEYLHKTLFQGSSLRVRFTRGVFWSLAGAIIAQILNLVTSILAARMLGREQFGELGIINSTIGLFGLFAGMGLGLTTNRYVALLKKEDPIRAGQIIGLTFTIAVVTSGTMALGLFIAAPWLAITLLNAPHLVNELRLGCLLLFVNALQGTQMGALAGFEDFRTLARIGWTQGLIALPVTAALIWMWQLSGALVAYIVTGSAVLIATQIALQTACRNNHIRVQYGMRQNDWQILWAFSLPALIVGVSAQPVQWLVRVWMVNQPYGYAEIALFTAAYGWSNAIQFVPARASSFLTSLLSNLYGDRSGSSYRRAFYANLAIALGTSALAAIAIALASTYIMRAYGAEFSSGAAVLVIVSLSAIFAAGTVAIRNVFYSQGRLWNQVVFSAIWSIALVGSLIFLPKTAFGLAVAYLISFVITFLVEIVVLYWGGLLYQIREEKANKISEESSLSI